MLSVMQPATATTLRALPLIILTLLPCGVCAATSKFTLLHSFSSSSAAGVQPSALVNIRGTLFGATSDQALSGAYGAVFAAKPSTGNVNVLYQFKGGADGATPFSTLTPVGAKLYGTTTAGGQFNRGTVFELSPSTGGSGWTEKVVHSFGSGTDGSIPNGLLYYNGVLWGTTQFGGSHTVCFQGGCGTIFTISPKTGTERVVYNFQGSDGANPYTLLPIEGILYGTTYRGGSGQGCVLGFGCGTLFSFDTSAATVITLHSFSATGSDGASPIGPLSNVGLVIYGTSNLDGNGGCAPLYGCGAVWSYDFSHSTGAIFTALHDFSGLDGSGPCGGVVPYNGVLYGTTGGGGSFNHGVIFSINQSTQTEADLHDFRGSDGSAVQAGLTYDGGKFYGTGYEGGADGGGTIFRFSPP